VVVLPGMNRRTMAIGTNGEETGIPIEHRPV